MYRVRVQLCEALENIDFCREAVDKMEGRRFASIRVATESVEFWIEDNRGREELAEGDTVYRTLPGPDGAPNWALVSDENVELTALIWVEEVKHAGL